MTRKTLNNSFVDFVDFVDPQETVEENQDNVTASADKHATCTWPVCRLRHPSTPSSDEETSATRTPDNDDAHSRNDDACSGTCDLETDVHVEEALFEANTNLSSTTNAAEQGLWLDDTDPGSPCAISMWQTAAASFYLPSPPATPAGLGPSPMLAAEPTPVTAEPSFLPGSMPCGWIGAAAGSTGAAPRLTRFQELRNAAGLPAAPATPPGAFGGAQPLGNVGSLLAASATSSYAATGLEFVNAASGGPLSSDSWATPARAAAVAPQMPAQVKVKAAAKAAKVRAGQPWAEGAQRRQGFQREDPNRLECRRHPAKQRCELTGPIQPLEERTTIMLRNVPNDYTRDMLHELIEAGGFGDKCDFLYLPVDFHTQSNLGYAFVNFERVEDTWRFWEVFEGFSKWAVRTKKVSSLRWSECQGLEANVKRYRNSPVMGESVPDCNKPAIYAGGERVVFPAPTKFLRAPRTKQAGLTQFNSSAIRLQ